MISKDKKEEKSRNIRFELLLKPAIHIVVRLIQIFEKGGTRLDSDGDFANEIQRGERNFSGTPGYPYIR